MQTQLLTILLAEEKRRQRWAHAVLTEHASEEMELDRRHGKANTISIPTLVENLVLFSTRRDQREKGSYLYL